MERLTISLLGETYDVELPRSFAEREDLVRYRFAPQIHQGLVFAAVIGRCTRLGRFAAQAARERGEAFEDYDRNRRILDYGSDVYDYLCGEGASLEELQTAALVILEAIRSALALRRSEVDAKKASSAATKAPTT